MWDMIRIKDTGRRRKAVEYEMEQAVDVVIPVCRPDERLMKILKRLRRQSYPVRKIYLMHTRSGKLPDGIEDMEGVTVESIEPEEFDHGATRDRGLIGCEDHSVHDTGRRADGYRAYQGTGAAVA